MKKRTRKLVLCGSAFALAAMLLAVNVVGLSRSLRNPSIYQEKDVYFPNDIHLTEAELRARFERPFRDRRELVEEVTSAVNGGIAHYWRDEGIDAYHLRIPATENYLLFIASYALPKWFRKYEFCDADRAIERGVGLCSQHAIIEQAVLRRKGMAARIVGLAGHVLLEADVAEPGQPPRWWLLDPDYGVVVPHSLKEVEQRPGLITGPYRSAGYDADTVAMLEGLFGASGNVTVESYSRREALERATYLLIWVIPVGLILAAAWNLMPKRQSRGSSDRADTQRTFASGENATRLETTPMRRAA